uniref:HNH nuclease domain-containing protein n=1 Tax=Chlamydomonas leiostraca TaxID=1034604 RepID=A0A7S0WND7_9CHLO
MEMQAAAAAQPPAAQPGDVATTLTRIERKLNLVTDIALYPLEKALSPPSEGHESKGTNITFKQKLIQHYGLANAPQGQLTCMVLGRSLPKQFIVAGHLLPRRAEVYAGKLIGTHVHDPRNGLLWNSAFEYAFERQWLCFSHVATGMEDNFMIHVINKHRLGTKLADVGEHRHDHDFKKAMGDLQFGDLTGTCISFSSQSSGRPLRRSLMIHAAQALKHCQAVYPDGFMPELHNFRLGSESGAQELVEAWLSSLPSHAPSNASQSLPEELTEAKPHTEERKKKKKKRKGGQKKRGNGKGGQQQQQ